MNSYESDPALSRQRVAALTVGIVGAGRVGRALGRLLHKAGGRIGPVITRSLGTAREARRRIGSGQPQTGVSESLLSVDLVLIATPDRAIAATAKALAQIGESKDVSSALRARKDVRGKAPRAAWSGKTVLHTSGALASDLLEPLRLQGAAIGSLHPLQTFSGRTVPSLQGSTCVIEGDPGALRMARRICRDLGGIAVTLPPGNKGAYHTGAALAAGHLLALFEAAVRMLVKSGFPKNRAVAALLPLTRQTLANFERVGASAAWTGPLSRGDFEVIRRHLEALHRFPREYRAAYEALSRLAANVLANGSPAKQHVRKRALERVLARRK